MFSLFMFLLFVLIQDDIKWFGKKSWTVNVIDISCLHLMHYSKIVHYICVWWTYKNKLIFIKVWFHITNIFIIKENLVLTSLYIIYYFILEKLGNGRIYAKYFGKSANFFFIWFCEISEWLSWIHLWWQCV